MDKIVVVGTGYVGLPAALMWARAGVEVLGVDIDERVVKALNEHTLPIEETELEGLYRRTRGAGQPQRQRRADRG